MNYLINCLKKKIIEAMHQLKLFWSNTSKG